MKEVRLKLPNGTVEKFQITYECAEYIFCECVKNPAARGFFTRAYVDTNQMK